MRRSLTSTFYLLAILLFPLSAHATNALNFTGTASEYVATNLQSGTIGSTFTVEAWVNPSKMDDNAIISTLEDSGMELHLSTNGALCLTLKGSSDWSDFVSPTGLVALNTWSHVAASFDGTAVKLYVNGVSAAVTGSMVGQYNAGTDLMTIGRRTANRTIVTSIQQFYGSLAEVQVWSMARNATEIKTDMGGYTAVPANLLAYYKLNQGTAGGDNTASTTVTDFVGNYAGTLTKFARKGASSNWVYWKHVAVQPTGDGIATPYQIDSLPNLDWVAQHSETWTLKFQQTKDIDASSTVNWDGGQGFSPIGKATLKFTGSYDGQGHTIAGLFINRTSPMYIGLFGYVGTSGVIAHLGLTGNHVNGGSNYVGGLIGCIEGTVSASYATGSATSAASAVVGGLIGANFGTVNASYATGPTTGGDGSFVGGLLGLNASIVSNSYATGSATGGADAYVGGLVGNNGSSLEKCYWNTTTSNLKAVGSGSSTGTIGKSSAEMKVWSTFTDWPFVGHTTAGTQIWDIDAHKNNGYPFLTWQYPRLTITAPVVSKVYDGSTSVASNQLTLGTLSGFGSDDVSLSAVATYATKDVGSKIPVTITYSLSGADAGKYMAPLPFTGNIGTITEAPLTITAKDFTIVLGDADPTFTVTYNGFVPNETETLVTNLQITCSHAAALGKYDIVPHGATAPNYSISYKNGSLIINPVPVKPKGTGVEGNPYLIDSLPNLYWLSQTSSVWGAIFQQTKDIDASSTADWDGGQGFSPIGDKNTNFTGSYDGQGHTIAGIFINRPSLFTVGLFGFVGSPGVITHLGLTGNIMTGGNGNVGGIVGFNVGTVSASYTTGSATGGIGANVGGVVGLNVGTVSASYATGSAIGEFGAIVGGFVGKNQKTVSECYAAGSATGGKGALVGGFAGSNSGTVIASYATGSVTGGATADVGGFAGRNEGTVSTSYATGLVTGGGGNVGGFNGFNTHILSKCYWNTTASGLLGVDFGPSTGTIGKSSAEMKFWRTFTDWPFVGHTTAGTLDTWDIDANKNNGFPILSWQNTMPRLTVTDPVVSSKVYDGTTNVASDKLTLGTLSGAGNDDVSLSGVATYVTKNVGIGISVTVTYSLSGADAGKYTAPLPFTVNTGTITEAPLTITANDFKIALGDADPAFVATYKGFVPNETEALVTNLQITCNHAVALGKYDIVPYGAAAANYSISYNNGSLIINPAPMQPKGSGVDGDPYLIDSLPNLYWLSQTSSVWGAKFQQINDIDASSTINWDGGKGFSPIGDPSTQFTGSYDGQGHTIAGLFIKRTSEDDINVGFFGDVGSSGVITQLGLTGNNVTGGVIANVGGIVGFNEGAVSASYATGSATGGASALVGGLIGHNPGDVSASYTTGSATGAENAYVGGFIGYSQGTISTSYVIGSTTGGAGAYVGGFLGGNDGALNKCYWNTTASIQSGVGIGSSDGSNGISSAEMKAWSTFTDWSFVGQTTAGTEIWDIDPNKNSGYPFLTWQYPRLTVTDPVVSSKVYDGTTSVASSQWNLGNLGGAGSDDVSLSGVATYATKDVGKKIPVTITYSLSGTDADKYMAPLPFTGEVGTITKAPLTITADDIKLNLGAKLPTTYKFTFSKFVNSEDESVLQDLDANLSCGTCKEAGVYKIVPTATSKNYELSFVNGKFTLNATSNVINRKVPVVNLEKLRHFDLQGRRVKAESL